VKAWTILKNTKAPQAAGRIHTDFEKGFIMAEVGTMQSSQQCSASGSARIPNYLVSRILIRILSLYTPNYEVSFENVLKSEPFIIITHTILEDFK